MFKKVLIANRGEIALRVIRACKDLGVATVAVYSEADKDSLPVRFADEDVCIGPAPSAQSYLDPKRIISAAEVTNSDAIHPGYGFLAENADFAEICEACNIKFIGPPARLIRLMGDKIQAKIVMQKTGIPVIPGSLKALESVDEASGIASEIGYPVLIKAAAGGGGKGMRIAGDEKSLKENFQVAQTEAKNSFGNPQVYLEKFFSSSRHIEFQILADSFGDIVHLGERDCTIQRKHQKLLEESPSPIMTDLLRDKMGKAAVLGAKSVGYQNVGTMEFLLDSEGNFYFMEMNTRIQVEHTITEEVVDMDLIREQIRIAYGDKLNYEQKDIILKGHAMECRINAEDPDREFLPSPGEISSFHVPGGHGVRVDTHAFAKYIIPTYYDSMIAKLITFGKSRNETILKMRRALEEFIIEGVKTTIPFHKEVLTNAQFIQGKYDTTFVEKLMAVKKQVRQEKSAQKITT